MLFLVNFLSSALRSAAPILVTTLGFCISERSGLLNIGIEGTMITGAFTGFTVSFFTGNPLLGIVCAVITGIAMNLLYGFFSISRRANQVVVGMAMNIFAIGLTGFLFRRFFSSSADWSSGAVVSTLENLPVPVLHRIPLIGPVLFNQNIIVYISFLLIPLLHIVLFHSALGLKIIATGEHPKAADSLGINVYRLRYWAVVFSGACAGLGGAYLSIAHSNTFVESMTAGRGFIALAVSILGRRKPWGVFAGALLFGGANSLQLRLQTGGSEIPYDLILMIPYILTVIAVVVFSRNQIDAPGALAKPYTKE
jgi:general nucleoside transport system permease protein